MCLSLVLDAGFISLSLVELDTNNQFLKMQIIELLSALCIYSEEGHATVIESFQHFKVEHTCAPLYNYR